MSEFGDFLKKLRGELSLREAARRSGLSYSYISSLEAGKHPKTGVPINPSPESLRGLSRAYNYDYHHLLEKAGYLEEQKKEHAGRKFPESEYDRIIKEAESHFDVNLRDDPNVEGAVRELVWRLAQMKKK